MPHPAVSLTQDQAAPPPPMPDSPPRPVAHWLHTLGLLLVLTMTTLFGRSRVTHAHLAEPRILRYATTMLLEWLLLGAVIAAIYRRREFFLTAFRNRAYSLGQALGFGLATYVLGLMSIALVSSALLFTPLAHQRNVEYVFAMLPRTPLEFLLWFAVSLTAGICEELIFRGYLLQQFTAWTRHPIASIILAALVFGSVHLYEGLGAILPLTALAVVYGFVVRYLNGDLRAVILAHTLQDFLVGFLGLARPFVERHQQTH